MLSRTEARDLINDLFEEEALVIGGLVAARPPDDDFLYRLFQSLEVIRSRFLRRIREPGPGEGGAVPTRSAPVRPHPAIERFLLGVRGAGGR